MAAAVPSLIDATQALPPMDVQYLDGKEESEAEAPTRRDVNVRGNWTGRFDFLPLVLGVGYDNLWLFVWYFYKNGRSAFIIPCMVMHYIMGLPLTNLELSLGQYTSLGPVGVFAHFCPLFHGIGFCMFIISYIASYFNNILLAYEFFYAAVSLISSLSYFLFSSFIFYPLPWTNCNAAWNTEHCYSYEDAHLCQTLNKTFYLRQCFNMTYATTQNISVSADVGLWRLAADEYFTYIVHGMSSGMKETGHMTLEMVACLFAASFITFLCYRKGVQSSRKMTCFGFVVPYAGLLILFFRVATLPGAITGIQLFFTPDFTQLANVQVWVDAAMLTLRSLNLGKGTLICLNSYSKLNNNTCRDSLIIVASNIFRWFLAGLITFSVIGVLEHELGESVDKLVDQGAGLAFILYPEVLTRLPNAPFWSFLFFVMMLILGFDTQFVLTETVRTDILDTYPKWRQNKVRVSLLIAVLTFLVGLIFITDSGMYWLILLELYVNSWSVLIIVTCQCIVIAWIYGAEKFCFDIQRMIGQQSRLWVIFWSSMWRWITPAALLFVLMFKCITYKPIAYGHYVYPMWAEAVGWMLGLLPLYIVVIVAIYKICSGPDDLTMMERVELLTRPIVRRPEPELAPPALPLHGRPRPMQR